MFEWPQLGLYAVYMWHKMLSDERSEHEGPVDVPIEDDPQLTAWNEYLASLHRPHVDEREKKAD